MPNLKIRFQGTEYILVGASCLEDGGAIATPETFKAGECSYAQLCKDGTIKRFLSVIGNVSEITVLGPDDTEPEDADFFKGWLGSTWIRR